MNFYPHHIGDFKCATRHLTRVELCLYIEVLWLYYDKEQPIKNDFSALSRYLLARSEEEVEALKQVLDEFFYLDGDVFRNNRCDAEIEKYQANKSAKARAGRASAEAREKKKALSKGLGKEQNSTGVEQVCNRPSTTKNQEPITNNQEPITNNHKKQDQNTNVSASANVPVEKIIDLYHEKLPSLPRVIKQRFLGSKRETHLKTRWRENKKHQSLEFWSQFFTSVNKIDFYMGHNNRQWKADLGWLLERGNFDKTLERLINL